MRQPQQAQRRPRPEVRRRARRSRCGWSTRADVVAENFRPGVMEKLGLGYEALKARKPGLIYASASGYGPDGPYVEKPGQDLLAQALFGMMAITGQAQTGPAPGRRLGHRPSRRRAVRHGHPRGDRAPAAHRAGLPRRRQPDAVGARPAGGVAGRLAQRAREARRRSTPTATSPAGTTRAPYGVYATKDGHLALSLSPLALLPRRSASRGSRPSPRRTPGRGRTRSAS